MANATTDRSTPRWGGGGSERLYEPQMAASTTILQGIAVGLNASGLLVPMSAVATLRVMGRSEEAKVSGASGVTRCKVSSGTFKWKNSGVNACTAAHKGTKVYFEDNQTVGSLATGFSVAGVLEEIDADGDVWVRTEPSAAPGL